MRFRFALYLVTASLTCLLVAPVQAQVYSDDDWRSDNRDYRDRYSDDANYDVWYYTDRDDENTRRELQRRDVDRDRQREVFSNPARRSATDVRDRERYDRNDRDSTRHSDDDSDAWRYDRAAYDYHTEDHLNEDLMDRDVDRKQARYKSFTNPALRGATELRPGDRYDYDYDYDADRYDYNDRYDQWERRQARSRDLDRDKEREVFSNPAHRSATEPKEWRGDYDYSDYGDDSFDEGYDYDYNAYDYDPNDPDDYDSSNYTGYGYDNERYNERSMNPARRGASSLGHRGYNTNR